MNNTVVGQTLRHLMEADARVNGNENALARLTGVSQPTIHRILSGESSEPRRSTLAPLAAYFGVAVEYLLTGSGINEECGDYAMPLRVRLTAARDLQAMQRLIDVYESLSPTERATLMRIVEAIQPRST